MISQYQPLYSGQATSQDLKCPVLENPSSCPIMCLLACLDLRPCARSSHWVSCLLSTHTSGVVRWPLDGWVPGPIIHQHMSEMFFYFKSTIGHDCFMVIAVGWNILDFIVVIFGFLELSSSFGNYTFLRSFRVLRPLRAITKIAALKVMMDRLTLVHFTQHHLFLCVLLLPATCR